MDTTTQASDSPAMTAQENESGVPPLPTEEDVTTQPFSEDDIPF